MFPNGGTDTNFYYFYNHFYYYYTDIIGDLQPVLSYSFNK